MKDELAERLFETVVDSWDSAKGDLIVECVTPLQRMASYKYDQYGGYGPGVKFMESLSVWLNQMDSSERLAALKFVDTQLIFVSEAEIRHALRSAYMYHVRPFLVREAALSIGVQPWEIQKVLDSGAFESLQRRTMFLGLADGARLDQFRRANRGLRQDQFSVSPSITRATAEGFLKKLRKQTESQDATFNRFVLIDDFSGSGFTMLRKEVEGWDGKLWKFRAHVEEELREWGVVDEDYTVHVLLYVSTEQALESLASDLEESELGWKISVVQTIPRSVQVVKDDPFLALCEKYHDPLVDTEHMKLGGFTGAHGFFDCRLPLVLSHNTPNNSVGLLWENTINSGPAGLGRHALFPRHERHVGSV